MALQTAKGWERTADGSSLGGSRGQLLALLWHNEALTLGSGSASSGLSYGPLGSSGQCPGPLALAGLNLKARVWLKLDPDLSSPRQTRADIWGPQ